LISLQALNYNICMHMGREMGKETPQSQGGRARRDALSPEERRAIARRAAIARWEGDLPVATHEGEFKLHDVIVSCAVLPNGTRIITQATFLRALGRSRSPKAGTGVLATVDGLPFFLQNESLKPFISDDLAMSTTPLFYRTVSGGKGVGYDARIMPQVAEVYLRYRDALLADKGKIPQRYSRMIAAADLLIRGLAHVGIIALVDEATGLQRDRAKDALERILQEFIAKELRPWVHTFPDQFYEQLFRLRGLEYPRDSVKRPQYFGHITNNIIYDRIAPGVREELLRTTPRKPDGRLAHHLHRRFSEDLGHPKLREHLSSVVTIMRLSTDYDDFMEKLDRIHPRYGDTYSLLEYPEGL
jgi:hypothetical protein